MLLLRLGWDLAALAGALYVARRLAFSLAVYLPRVYPGRKTGLIDTVDAVLFIPTVARQHFSWWHNWSIWP